MRRRPAHVDAPRGEVDHEHRVVRDEAGGLEGAPNRRSPHAVPDVLQRALDPCIDPRRILPRKRTTSRSVVNGQSSRVNRVGGGLDARCADTSGHDRDTARSDAPARTIRGCMTTQASTGCSQLRGCSPARHVRIDERLAMGRGRLSPTPGHRTEAGGLRRPPSLLPLPELPAVRRLATPAGGTGSLPARVIAPQSAITAPPGLPPSTGSPWRRPSNTPCVPLVPGGLEGSAERCGQ
jgi:hypothetical protein